MESTVTYKNIKISRKYRSVDVLSEGLSMLRRAIAPYLDVICHDGSCLLGSREHYTRWQNFSTCVTKVVIAEVFTCTAGMSVHIC